MRNTSSRSDWLTTFLFLSLVSSFASAGLLNRRQSDGTSPSVNGATAAPETTISATNSASGVTGAPSSAISTSLAGTASIDDVATTTGATETAAEATATAVTSAPIDTEAASLTTPATASATGKLSKPLDDTNNPHGCHVKPLVGNLGNPFCEPSDGETYQVGDQYPGTQPPSPLQSPLLPPLTAFFNSIMDESLFPANSTNTILLQSLIDTGPDATDNLQTLQTNSAPNTQGTIYLTMNADWLNTSAPANLSISLQNSQRDGTLPGPEFTLTNNSTSNNTSSNPSSDKSKKLGQAVGIPVGLVFLIGAVALIAGFLYMRKRRGLGYGGGKAARGQRLDAAAVPVAGRGHRRGESFHDEPTRGVELQERNRGLTGEDNWDWGSPVSSPTAGEGGGNAFREEVQRQRGGRRG